MQRKSPPHWSPLLRWFASNPSQSHLKLSHRHLYRSQIHFIVLYICNHLRIAQLNWPRTTRHFDSIYPPRPRSASIQSSLQLRCVHPSSQPLPTHTLHLSKPLQNLLITSITASSLSHQICTSLPHSSIYPSWSLRTYSVKNSFKYHLACVSHSFLFRFIRHPW